jgi:phage repressor protein C with HTH and peptisase S24 domain
MKTLAERFTQARLDAGMRKKVEASRALGISASAVTQIESGSTQKLDSDTLMKASRLFKVNPVWLASGRGTKRLAMGADDIVEENPDYPAIRRVRFKLSAGIAGFAIEYEDPADGPPMYFHKTWYQSRHLVPRKLYAIKVAGGSMEPGMTDKDTVVVNTGSVAPKDGAVFALNFEGELVVKRLFKLGERWVAASDNPDKTRYRDKPLGAGTIVLGEIVHKQSERI